MRNVLTGILIGLVASSLFVGGFATGMIVDRNQGISTSDRNLQDFLSAYRLVTHNYYGRVSHKQLIYSAIDGMMAATGDPHTLFLPPSQNVAAGHELNGQQYDGIGAIVVPRGRYIEILAALPHSPAQKAGLRSGDRVLAINGQPVAHLPGNIAIARIHGRAGTRVRLRVADKGVTRTVAVARAPIPAVTAYGRWLSHHIGYIQIFSFGIDTATEVQHALQGLRGARGIVLDMRGNPGGYVSAAQAVVSDFLSKGVVAYEKAKAGSVQALPVIQNRQLTHAPVAILVDGDTASAAEITAAALRDEDHAILIGAQTYGKGSMQSVYTLGDGSSVRVTDRLWLTPRHKSIQGVGLKPNIHIGSPVTTSSDPALRTAVRYLEAH